MNLLDIILIVIGIILVVLAIKFLKKIVLAIIGLILVIGVFGTLVYFLSQYEAAANSQVLNYVMSSKIVVFIVNLITFIVNLFS
ncbi:MAG: hypothetical protein ABID45_02200 [Patescibacteria group bacterium]